MVNKLKGYKSAKEQLRNPLQNFDFLFPLWKIQMPWGAPDSLPRAWISGAQVFELCKHTHIQLSFMRTSEVTHKFNNGQTYFMHHHHHSAVSENLA